MSVTTWLSSSNARIRTACPAHRRRVFLLTVPPIKSSWALERDFHVFLSIVIYQSTSFLILFPYHHHENICQLITICQTMHWESITFVILFNPNCSYKYWYYITVNISQMFSLFLMSEPVPLTTTWYYCHTTN